MKIPDKISNITELARWVEKRKPKIIEIGEKSKLQKIVELKLNHDAGSQGKWRGFRGIPIRYLF